MNQFHALLCSIQIAFCSRLEEASDVLSSRFARLAVPVKTVKSRDPDLKRSKKIRPNVVGGGIFDSYFAASADRM